MVNVQSAHRKRRTNAVETGGGSTDQSGEMMIHVSPHESDVFGSMDDSKTEGAVPSSPGDLRSSTGNKEKELTGKMSRGTFGRSADVFQCLSAWRGSQCPLPVWTWDQPQKLTCAQRQCVLLWDFGRPPQRPGFPKPFFSSVA